MSYLHAQEILVLRGYICEYRSTILHYLFCQACSFPQIHLHDCQVLLTAAVVAQPDGTV